MSGRYSFLRSPVWVIGILLVVVTVVVFVNLGMWQLRRLDVLHRVGRLLFPRGHN